MRIKTRVSKTNEDSVIMYIKKQCNRCLKEFWHIIKLEDCEILLSALQRIISFVGNGLEDNCVWTRICDAAHQLYTLTESEYQRGYMCEHCYTNNKSELAISENESDLLLSQFRKISNERIKNIADFALPGDLRHEFFDINLNKNEINFIHLIIVDNINHRKCNYYLNILDLMLLIIQIYGEFDKIKKDRIDKCVSCGKWIYKESPIYVLDNGKMIHKYCLCSFVTDKQSASTKFPYKCYDKAIFICDQNSHLNIREIN